jgi:pseudo-response regulator 7
MESGTIIKNGAEDGNGSGNCPSGSGNDICQNQLSQREAAVNKFRQKRKERNFEKKVTYIVSKAGSSKISVVLIF